MAERLKRLIRVTSNKIKMGKHFLLSTTVSVKLI